MQITNAFKCSVFLVSIGVSTLGLANTMILPTNSQLVQQSMPVVNLPSTGLKMQQVASTFGQPAEKKPSVGQPPITIWRYADFNVYFENQRVLHSVRFVPYVRPIQIIIE